MAIDASRHFGLEKKKTSHATITQQTAKHTLLTLKNESDNAKQQTYDKRHSMGMVR